MNYGTPTTDEEYVAFAEYCETEKLKINYWFLAEINRELESGNTRHEIAKKYSVSITLIDRKRKQFARLLAESKREKAWDYGLSRKTRYCLRGSSYKTPEDYATLTADDLVVRLTQVHQKGFLPLTLSAANEVRAFLGVGPILRKRKYSEKALARYADILKAHGWIVRIDTAQTVDR